MRRAVKHNNCNYTHTIAAILTSMNLNHLQVFQRVVQARSFAVAARALRVDRTRVSRVIGALERDLGVRLFVRTTRSVAPTPEGQALARRIAGPLGELEGAVAAVPAARAIPTGEVTLTATADAARALLAPLLPRFRSQCPAVRLRLELSDEVVPFTRGIDLALRVGRPGAGSLVARKLRNLEAGFFAAPSYLAARGAPHQVPDLAAHDGLWPMVRGTRSFAPGAPPPPPAIACADFGALAALAVHGAGVALVPIFVAAPHVARGELVRVVPGFAVGGAPLYLVSGPPAQLPARVTALRDFLIEALAA